MACAIIAKTIEITFVHKQKKFFLVFRRQTMDLIKEQKSAIRIIKGSAFFAVGSGECAAGIAKKRCRKQLRVVGIVGTVQFNEWLISRDHTALDGILINQCCQMAFTDAAFS